MQKLNPSVHLVSAIHSGIKEEAIIKWIRYAIERVIGVGGGE